MIERNSQTDGVYLPWHEVVVNRTVVVPDQRFFQVLSRLDPKIVANVCQICPALDHMERAISGPIDRETGEFHQFDLTCEADSVEPYFTLIGTYAGLILAKLQNETCPLSDWIKEEMEKKG